MKERLCKYCNQPFTPPAEKHWQRYCSIECSEIGTNQRKNREKGERINAFYDELDDMEIIDVLNGKLPYKGMSSRMSVKGSRNYEGCRFVVVVVKKKKGEE